MNIDYDRFRADDILYNGDVRSKHRAFPNRNRTRKGA
jgi:hypothetical protein